jgi:outer membrane immunogenic protein
MKKWAIYIMVVAGLIGTPALAADLGRPVYKAAPPPPPAPVFSWTGFYVGGHAGGGWSNESVTANPLPDPVTYGFVQENANINGSGAVGGGQIGYNWQVTPAYLLGLEGDFSWSGIRGSATTGPIQSIPPGLVYVPGSFFQATNKFEWLSSIRGRVGLTWDRLLVYGTGGVAWTRIDYSGNDAFVATSVFNPGSLTTTKSGWVAGAGIEYAFTNNWSARLEYLHYGFDGSTFIGPRVPALPPFGVQFVTGNPELNIIRAGVDYKFGS